MKKKACRTDMLPNGDDMQPEYDFRGGVRGKHYKACRDGYTVKIHNEDGTTSVQEFVIGEGTVKLDPDVRAYFPDGDSVNTVLRSIIALIPPKRRARAHSRQTRAGA